jgi:hypothetical protein
VRISRRGLPKASTRACSLVVNPPRERPRDGFSGPLLHPQRQDEQESRCCRGCSSLSRLTLILLWVDAPKFLTVSSLVAFVNRT